MEDGGRGWKAWGASEWRSDGGQGGWKPSDDDALKVGGGGR